MDQNTRQHSTGAKQPQWLARQLYNCVWRWHFFAGLFVVPFLAMLSVTGIVMLYDEQIQAFRYNTDYELSAEHKGSAQHRAAVSTLFTEVKKVYPAATIKKYISAKTAKSPSFVVIKQAQGPRLHIALNPYTAEVLGAIDRDDSWYALANDIHGTLLIGEIGDRLIEIAAGLMLLLLISGVYLWLPRKSPKKVAVFYPRLHRGKRTFWRDLHSSLGFYSIVVLLFFVISGLSWSGVWGGKMVQAWNSFPAQKWDNVPLSENTHSDMNQGVMEEVPWNLEQTAMPNSVAVQNPSKEGGAVVTVSVDEIVKQAERLGMAQYQLNLPTSNKGVFTLSADTMSGDITDPRLDRTVHIDQYSGNVLADVGWSEYSAMAKFMAAGIGLHQGDVGIVNLIVNTLFCVIFILICASGLVLWWQRRPANSLSLAAPQVDAQMPIWKSGLVIVIALSVLFPLTGLSIVAVLFIDIMLQLLNPFLRKVLKGVNRRKTV